ncbi:MAG: hypothetical protein E7235_06465 [Lachnospiraceae bacterium]|nr:hypothetical protein [Lachnospiraceae bacterium]
MTEKLYYIDQYKTEFTATVIDCIEDKKGYKIVLDKTLFYPEGGGQPADMGTLGSVNVFDVHEKDDIIYHYTDAPLQIGAEVNGKIDWLHRFDLMQNHSGEHILSGIICRKYGCDNVGFHMGKDMITIDFNTKIPAEDIEWLENKANEAVWTNAAVGVRYPSKDELVKIDYRSKKEIDGEVRIVNVGEYDCCACCGTHVRYAGEIGQIKIIGIQSYKGGTRMEMLCGMRALNDYRKKSEITSQTGALLSVPALKTGEAVKKLTEEKEDMVFAYNGLKLKYFEIKADMLVKDVENVIVFEDDLNGKDMTAFADILIKKGAKRAAVFSASADGYAFTLISTKKDARKFADEMKDVFGSKGGGKDISVQGMLNVDKDVLKNFFEQKGFVIY